MYLLQIPRYTKSHLSMRISNELYPSIGMQGSQRTNPPEPIAILPSFYNFIL